MDKKGLIRVKYKIKRKKNYFNTKSNFFNPLIKLLKKIKLKKILYLYTIQLVMN